MTSRNPILNLLRFGVTDKVLKVIALKYHSKKTRYSKAMLANPIATP
jgi:hypothetical protein